jgi:hypothetical protein
MSRFIASIHRLGVLRCVDVPRRVARACGRGKYLPAIARYAGDADRVILVPGRRGHHRLFLKMELLRAAKLDAGDRIEIVLTPDAAPREPAVPTGLQRAFQLRPKAAHAYAACTLSIRRQICAYAESAKRPDPRANRIENIVERLVDGSLK